MVSHQHIFRKALAVIQPATNISFGKRQPLLPVLPSAAALGYTPAPPLSSHFLRNQILRPVSSPPLVHSRAAPLLSFFEKSVLRPVLPSAAPLWYTPEPRLSSYFLLTNRFFDQCFSQQCHSNKNDTTSTTVTTISTSSTTFSSISSC